MTLWQPWSLRSAVADLVVGRIEPRDLTERARSRIRETEALLEAWVAFDAAPNLEPDGPLRGVPLGVKDIIDVRGLPTRCGSRLRLEEPPAVANASIVDAWARAGAVSFGKTVTTEFAYFAPGPTRNPCDLSRTPGGSSSGSAAAVAAGHVPLALGTQTAASVTRPAAFCGVASLVMTTGRIPMTGVVGLAPSLDSHGMLAAKAADVAFAWAALANEPEVPPAEQGPPRLLVWRAGALGLVSEEMDAALNYAARRLEGDGAVLTPFPYDDVIVELISAHRTVMAYEAARERRSELDSITLLSEPLASLLTDGLAVSDEHYGSARQLITDAAEKIQALLGDFDGVLAPAAAGEAPEGLSATGDPTLSRPWQALGLPAVCIPGMRSKRAMPLGLQLIGQRHAESAALGTSRWIEARLT